VGSISSVPTIHILPIQAYALIMRRRCDHLEPRLRANGLS
jgi:hypothetical protein